MKIVFLGNSLTWGRYGGDFVATVAEKLPEHEIINAGESGNTIFNLRQRLDDILEMEPDAIFVMGGGNDAISYSQPATRPYYEQVHKLRDGMVTPEQFTQQWRDLLTQIQLHHVLAWVGLSPIEHNPAVVAALTEFNALTRQVAETLSVPVLDMMAHFPPPHPIPDRPPLGLATINLIGKRTREDWSDYETARREGGFTFTFDGLHLTPDAARKFGEIVTDFIRSNV